MNDHQDDLQAKAHDCWNGCPESCEGCQAAEWTAAAEFMRRVAESAPKTGRVAEAVHECVLILADRIERGEHRYG